MLASQIAKWTIVSLQIFGAIVIIANVGKPRKPTTGATAATGAVISGLVVTAIVVFWR